MIAVNQYRPSWLLILSGQEVKLGGALRCECGGKKTMEPDSYKEQILNVLARRFDENDNSLPDAYALIWAIDVYASFVWFATGKKNTETGKKSKEPDFKDEIDKQCEPFKIIRSASNAIKHIERNDNGFFVKSINDIQAGEGSSFHAKLKLGSSAPSISITAHWNYDTETQKYSIYQKGEEDIIPPPESEWKTQYLKELYQPAIDAIDKIWTDYAATNPVQNPTSC
jgi:hypothetical protein